MPDNTIFVLLFYLVGQPADEGRIGAIFARKKDCDIAKSEADAALAVNYPNDKQTRHVCMPWTLINSLDD